MRTPPSSVGFTMHAKHFRFPLLSLTLAAAAAASLAADDWPDFRGSRRDGVYDGKIASNWPAEGPERVWEKAVGAGFANPVVAAGRVILFHRQGSSEVVEALDAATGDTVWKYEYPTSYRDDFGFDPGPRAGPVVAGGQVYTFGAEGMLTCLRFSNGAKIWAVDTHKEFGVRKNFFGAGATPLVDGVRLFQNVGGADGAGIVAFDRDTGRVLWQATDHGASYASPIAVDVGGERRICFFTREGVVLADPATGEVVYEKRWRARMNASVNAATPIFSDEKVLFVSASYGTGAIALDFSQGLPPAELWSGEESLTNHYATAVLHKGVLYGYDGRQEYSPNLRAVELRTGKVLWSEDGFGAGTVTLADGKLILLRENGELVLAEASTAGFRPAARAQIFAGTTRAYPAIAGGALYARDESTLVRLNLGSH